MRLEWMFEVNSFRSNYLQMLSYLGNMYLVLFLTVDIFKPKLFMKAAISEFAILNFQKIHDGSFSQSQLEYALPDSNWDHL